MAAHALESQLQRQLTAHDWQSVTTMVAVSGGADSIALLRGLASLRTPSSARLVVAHFNHRLRGEESDADETFVKNLADQLNLPWLAGHAAPNALVSAGDSQEAAARQARYQFLERAAAEMGARYLFTAHTADDQAETILHRIVRGTGIAGLAGIPRVRALSPLTTIVRPLLSVRRQQVLDYLEHLGQAYRHDSTNESLEFTRNRLRHDLLPLLRRDYNPQVTEALLQLGQLADEAQGVIDRQVAQLADQAVRSQTMVEVVVDTSVLAGVSPYLVRELFVSLWQQQAWPLQAMTFEKWHELEALARSGSDELRTLPGAIRARKQGEQLVLTRPGS